MPEAMEIAKMIHTLSKEPAHTLYLLVSQEAGDKAVLAELQYRDRTVIVTLLGSGIRVVNGVRCTDCRQFRSAYEVKKTPAAMSAFMTLWGTVLTDICYGYAKRVGFTLFEGQCCRYQRQTEDGKQEVCFSLKNGHRVKAVQSPAGARGVSDLCSECILLGGLYCGKTCVERFPLQEGWPQDCTNQP